MSATQRASGQRHTQYIYLAAVIFWALSAGGALGERKHALVIGNNKYVNLPPQQQLERAVSDARSVAKTFAKLGFVVSRGENVARAEFNSMWQRLLEQTQSGDLVAFYFSGHGVEIDGLNFLLPTDVPNVSYGRQEQLKREALSVSEFLLDLRRRTPQLTVLILDACRDHPLIPPEYRSAGNIRGGLAKMDAPAGTFIMYSAGAGETALDRLPQRDSDLTNSVYTRKLLPLMTTSGLSLPDLARQLRIEVRALAATAAHVQTPAYYDGVIGQFCLAGCESADTSKTTDVDKKRMAAAEQQSADHLEWVKASAANRLDSYRAYLKAQPSGQFASQARAKVTELERLAAIWEDLRVRRDLPRLQSFAQEAVNSEFGPVAAIRLKELEANETAAWNVAEGQKHLAGYQAFTTAWPTGFFAEAAKEKMVELSAIKREWEKIKGFEDEQTLEAFVLQHGWTEFGAEATARLVALRRENSKPSASNVKVLVADEMLKAIDGTTIRFQVSGEVLSFGTRLTPQYRAKLGNNFLKQLLNEDLAAEGAFKAQFPNATSAHTIEGIGGVVKSRVDKTGSVFLLQMHGGERSAKDVDEKDRHFKTFQIVQDAFWVRLHHDQLALDTFHQQTIQGSRKMHNRKN